MSAPSFADWLAARPEGGASAGAAAPALPANGGFLGFFETDPTAAPAAPASAAAPDAWAALGALGAVLRGVGGGGGGGGDAAASPPAAPAEPEWTCGMSAAQRFQAFGLLLLGSVSLYFAAIFLFLPMVIFMPAKFATTFTFASIMWMAAFAILRGPRATLRGLLGDRDKRGFTAAYVGSLALTLYSTMATSSYFLPLVAIFIQVSAMLWYMSSSVPGGQAAMASLTSWCIGGITGRSVGAASWAGGAIARSGISSLSAAVGAAVR